MAPAGLRAGFQASLAVHSALPEGGEARLGGRRRDRGPGAVRGPNSERVRRLGPADEDRGLLAGDPQSAGQGHGRCWGAL